MSHWGDGAKKAAKQPTVGRSSPPSRWEEPLARGAVTPVDCGDENPLAVCFLLFRVVVCFVVLPLSPALSACALPAPASSRPVRLWAVCVGWVGDCVCTTTARPLRCVPASRMPADAAAGASSSCIHNDNTAAASAATASATAAHVLLLSEPALIWTTLAVVFAALFLLCYHCLCRRRRCWASAMGVRSSKHELQGPGEGSPTGKQVLNDALSGHSVSAGGGGVAGGPMSRARMKAAASASGGGGAAVAGDKVKFHDPVVLENMRNIAEEDKERFRRFDEWLIANGTSFPDLEYRQCV